jgi:hypothetical protein
MKTDGSHYIKDWHLSTKVSMSVHRFAADRALLSRGLQYGDAAAKKRYICRPKCQHNYICRQRNADFDLYKECKDSYVDDSDSTQLPPEQGTAATGKATEKPIVPVSSTEPATNPVAKTTPKSIGSTISISALSLLPLIMITVNCVAFLNQWC